MQLELNKMQNLKNKLQEYVAALQNAQVDLQACNVATYSVEDALYAVCVQQSNTYWEFVHSITLAQEAVDAFYNSNYKLAVQKAQEAQEAIALI